VINTPFHGGYAPKRVFSLKRHRRHGKDGDELYSRFINRKPDLYTESRNKMNTEGIPSRNDIPKRNLHPRGLVNHSPMKQSKPSEKLELKWGGIRTTKIQFAGQNALRPGNSRPIIRKSHSGSTDYARFLDRPDIYLALGGGRK
jgi:hypothetical protein